jgi:hypothetical protein
MSSRGAHAADYSELDATFHCVGPYAAVIPTAIIGNCGLRLGLVLAPSERTASYEIFWADLGLTAEELQRVVFSKALLSDGGRH